MNLFGIGNLELIVILLIALIVLGPGRMVEVARTLGQFWREAQHTLRSVADAATVKLDEPFSLNVPPRDPVAGPEEAVARPPSSAASDEGTAGEGAAEDGEVTDGDKPGDEGAGSRG